MLDSFGMRSARPSISLSETRSSINLKIPAGPVIAPVSAPGPFPVLC